MEALLDNFDAEFELATCAEWVDEKESDDTAWGPYCDEIDAWARQASAANGFGDY